MDKASFFFVDKKGTHFYSKACFLIFMLFFLILLIMKLEMLEAVKQRAEKILAHGQTKEVITYLADNPQEQLILFFPEHQNWLEAYLDSGVEFYEANVVWFAKIATPEQLRKYLQNKNFLTQDAELELLYHLGAEGVKVVYQCGQALSETTKIFLMVRLERHELLGVLPYLAPKGLSEVCQQHLFAKKRLDLIKAYVENGGALLPEYQCELVKLGVQDLIDAYFVRHPMSPEAEKLLNK